MPMWLPTVASSPAPKCSPPPKLSWMRPSPADIAWVAVNDAFVMKAWGQTQDVGDKVTLIADGNGDFTRAMDLVFDGSGIGLGSRSKRYAAVIEDGVITTLNVESKAGLDVSSAE